MFNLYSQLDISGYSQLRYNRLFETNPNLSCEQCDRSWGSPGGFFLRRVRLKFQADLSNKVFIYLQPDFASGGFNLGQLRDAYVDISLDSNRVWRFRAGQSKVPFGFENMQSSQNRLPLDRNDGLNSGLSNERDIGVFFYWTPERITKLHESLIEEGLKGSGNYGSFAFGVYNGQLANNLKSNDKIHLVSRFSYPFKIKGNIWETGIQAYKGYYTISKENVSTGVIHRSDLTYLDQRVAISSILYPKPLGLQFEWNWGTGPEFNKDNNSIENKRLSGGYILINYKIENNNMLFYPFGRYHYYSGGKKHEKDARSYDVSEFEIGLEIQPNKNLELVLMYVFSNRRYEDYILNDNLQQGRLLRLQLQVNF